MSKKRVLALLMAGIILVAATTACSNNPEENESTTGNGMTVGTGLVDPTDTLEDETGDPSTPSKNPGSSSTNTDINETNPSWTEKAGTVVVISKTAVNVRKDTSTESKVLGTVKDGDTLEATKYSDNWYCVTYEGETGYISRRRVVEADKELEDSFVEYSAEITVTAETSISIRRYPAIPAEDDEKSHLVCGYLKNGAKVTCVAKGDGWYKVEFKTDKEGTVDKDGTETRTYYITASTSYVEEETTAQ